MDPKLVVRAVAVVAVLALAGVVRPPGAPPPALSASAHPQLTQGQIDAGMTFGPGVQPFDRQLIESAVAAAQPAARALVERVDGITTIDVGPTPAGASGVTRGGGDHYDIVLDLGEVYRALGPRGADRLVLHELGHVVDHALVPEAVKAQLDAGIPPAARARRKRARARARRTPSASPRRSPSGRRAISA